MSDTPKWEDVATDPDWRWVADAPGQIVKFRPSSSSQGAREKYTDAETESTNTWCHGIEAKYGRHNVAAGRAANPGPNCSFALYVRRSALT